MSYTDPVRLFLKGDRVAAQNYIRAGRVLLYRTMRAAAASGVIQGRRKYRYDRAEIEVLFAGRQAAIVIYVAPEGGADVKIEEQFVVWARTEDLLPGIDVDHPQQMLAFRESEWRTLFYSNEIAGYEDFAGVKGVYRTENNVVVFPDGVRHAGNIDWRSKDGMRVSWYGPSSRYWFDPYTQPQSQYGKFVFMLGQIVLDVDQYILDSEPDAPFDERYVMGAALEGTSHLLVVHADLPFFPTPPETVPEDSVVAYMPVSRLTAPYTTPLTVCRYEIAVADPEDDPTKFSVVPGSREVITTFSQPTAFNPWFFNEAASHAVSVLPPSDVFFVGSGLTVVHAPQASSRVCTLVVDSANITHVEVGAAPGGAPAVIAADFKQNTLVELVLRRTLGNGGDDTISLEMAGRSWTLRENVQNGGRTNQTCTFSFLLFADLRSDVLLLHEQKFNVDFPSGSTVTPEYQRIGLYCGSGQAFEESTFDAGFPSGLIRTIADQSLAIWDATQTLATLTVAPQFFLYQIRAIQAPLVVLLRFQGCIGSYGYLAYRPEHYFGGYGLYNSGSAAPLTTIASRSNVVSPLDDQNDFEGHQSVLGCAGYEGVAMASTYAARAPLGTAANLVLNPDAPTTLPALTGVAGEKQRYHPIWLLGALPRTEV